jgi:nucleoside-diphosphate-sugar epimerase
MSAAAAFNRRIRLEGGANVLAAARAAGVRRYLRQSIAFWAAPGPGLADEDTPLLCDASPAVAADARVVTEIEQRLLETPDIEGIVLRYGFFYGPGTWFNPDGDVAQQVRGQQFPVIGNGEGVWSWLHIADAATATVAAAERGLPGVYLIADDRPLAVREWLPAFAQWLKAPPPPQVPVDDVLQAGGADAVYYGTQLRGASNAKARRELHFQPRPLEWVAEAVVAHTAAGRRIQLPESSGARDCCPNVAS